MDKFDAKWDDKAQKGTYSDKIHWGEMKNNINFFQVEPDSHFWTSIEMLLNNLNGYKQSGINLVNIDYLIKGLENTLKQGYDIKRTTESD